MKTFTTNQEPHGRVPRAKTGRAQGALDPKRRIAALEKKRATGELTTSEVVTLRRLKSVMPPDRNHELRQALGLREDNEE